MKTAPKSAIYDSMKAAAAGTGLDFEVIRGAKDAGCPAFRSNRVDADELLVWLGQHPEIEGADLSVDSPAYGLALLAELFVSQGCQFWITSHAVCGRTLLTMPAEGDVDLPPDFPPGFLKAAVAAVQGLKVLASLAPKAVESMRAAGIEADVEPWLALAETTRGLGSLAKMGTAGFEQYAKQSKGQKQKGHHA